MELESFEKMRLLCWISFPACIALAILQSVAFFLYHGSLHPLAAILDGCDEYTSNSSK